MQPIALVNRLALVNRRKPERSAPAISIGVVGTTDPVQSLSSAGVEPSYHDEGAAFAGPAACDPTGSVWIFGEVLLDNAPELQRSLEMDGATHAELLAALFAAVGEKAIAKARGMFAVAVWQPTARKLTLLRDGVGARTIYYASKGVMAWFAPTIRGLRCSPIVSSELSLPALRNYLTCAFVPGSDTMFKDIHEVRPGSAVILPQVERHTLWTPAEGVWDREESMEAGAARLRPLLEDAVNVCLPPSGPVGVFLSGGLDSSLVTALAARSASGPVHTYAIHFGEGYRNELEFSSMVAEHCKTRHRIIELPGRQILQNIEESISALDDPIGDPLTTPNLILGKVAAQDVGIILNGEGGDPCFGGPKNLPMVLNELYGGAAGREQAYLRAYQKCYDDLPELLTPELLATLQRGYPPQEAFFAPFLNDESPTQSYLNRLMLINTLLKGSDNILTKVSNLTQHNGLIGRSPLFDRRIVEASFAIPPEYKQAGAIEKAILKRAVADLLPEPILTRPKSGMLVPVQGWFKTDLKRMAKSMLLGRNSRLKPYIRQEIIKEWLGYRGSLWPRHGVKLWLLLTLEIWLRSNDF